MNYRKAYRNIMNRAKSENRTKDGKIYYESHHIIPNFMFKNRKGRLGPIGHLEGDCDDKNNLVLLTMREHFLAHLLLTKIYAKTRYEFSAKKSLVWFFTLVEKSLHPRKEWYNLSRLEKYEKYRELAIDGIRKSMSGTMLVKDAKTNEKIGRVSTQHLKVLSGAWVHWTKGRKNTKEQNIANSKRMSGMGNPNAKKNITRQTVVDAVVEYVIDNKKFGKHVLLKEIVHTLDQKLNVSVMVMNNRFPDGITELVSEVNSNLINKNLSTIKFDSYFRGEEQKKRLSSAASAYKWVTDGIINVRVNAVQLEQFLQENKTYKQGRTL